MATLPVRHAEFAAALAGLMKDKFDTKDLMQVTGATFAAVKRWQNGQAYPRRIALQEICKLMGVTITELTGKADEAVGQTRVVGKPVTSLQVIAKRLDEIGRTIEALKRERDELKRQMMAELSNMDADL